MGGAIKFMDKNLKKELFSKAYVKALAAQLGFRTCEPDVDDDSIDIIVRGRGFESHIRNPQLDVQLKCTAKNSGDENTLKFLLPIKNYNDLRGDDLLCPRYLFVFLVPESCEEWIGQEDNHIMIRHCCYWVSLSELPGVANTSSVTIDIPRDQKLTSDSIYSLMEMASNAGLAAL